MIIVFVNVLMWFPKYWLCVALMNTPNISMQLCVASYLSKLEINREFLSALNIKMTIMELIQFCSDCFTCRMFCWPCCSLKHFHPRIDVICSARPWKAKCKRSCTGCGVSPRCPQSRCRPRTATPPPTPWASRRPSRATPSGSSWSSGPDCPTGTAPGPVSCRWQSLGHKPHTHWFKTQAWNHHPCLNP